MPRLVLATVVALPVVLSAFPSTRYRLYGSNLTQAPQWTVHSLRLLASPTCEPSTRITTWEAVGSSGVVCSSSIAAFCGLTSTLYGPAQPLNTGHGPSLAYLLNPWRGTAPVGDQPHIEVNFSTPTAIGCVQLFQSPSSRAHTLTLIAVRPGGAPDDWALINEGSATACPDVNSQPTCCRLAQDEGWSCPYVSSLSAGALPPAPPGPPSAPAPPLAPPPSDPPPPPLPPHPPPHPPVAQGNGRNCGPSHGHTRCYCNTGKPYCHAAAGLCGATAAYALADDIDVYDCTPPSPPHPPAPPPPPPTGCTSIGAVNYAPSAEVDDGSCIIGGCTDPASSGYNSRATYNDGSCPQSLLGCTDPSASNYRALATADDGSCRHVGCMISTASNYDPTAQISGACTRVLSGCTNPAAINYYPDATLDDGSCVIVGCTDSSRSNYNPSANFDHGLCAPTFPGCTDQTKPNYKPQYTHDDGSCSVPGCTNSAASNYNSLATHDDGTCATSTSGGGRRQLGHPSATPGGGCMDPQSSTYNASATTHMPGACEYLVLGCTDPAAHNYLAAANQTRSPTECHYLIRGCTVPSATNFDSRANALDSCAFDFPGCTAPAAPNYAAAANRDDGSCLPAVVHGCADSLAANFAPSATVSAGCQYHWTGCKDSAARNYAADTTIHAANQCVYAILGCMLPLAANYAPAATLDDGSCVLHSPPSSPPSPSPLPIPPALLWPAPPTLPAPSSPGITPLQTGSGAQQLGTSEDEGSDAMPAWVLAVVIALVAVMLIAVIAICFWCDRRLRRRAGREKDELAAVQVSVRTEDFEATAACSSISSSDITLQEAQVGDRATYGVHLYESEPSPKSAPPVSSPHGVASLSDVRAARVSSEAAPSSSATHAHDEQGTLANVKEEAEAVALAAAARGERPSAEEIAGLKVEAEAAALGATAGGADEPTGTGEVRSRAGADAASLTQTQGRVPDDRIRPHDRDLGPAAAPPPSYPRVDEPSPTTATPTSERSVRAEEEPAAVFV